MRVIKEGSAPQGWVKDLLGFSLCWWHWGHTHKAGGTRVPQEGTAPGNGSRVTSALPAAQRDPAAPQQGNAPVPRKFSVLKCSPALWDGWGSGRKEVQARGVSPPRYTLISTAGWGVRSSSSPLLLEVCREVGSGPQTCSGGSAQGCQ